MIALSLSPLTSVSELLMMVQVYLTNYPPHICHYVRLYIIIADAIDDYIPQNRQLSFSANQRSLCHFVLFNDDETVERRESFGVILERTSGLHERVFVCEESAEVVIPNNDGEIPKN